MDVTCTHRRSRFTTPLAMVLGAVLVSGTSAYAAATITGAQIADNTVSSADITNNSLTYADIKDGYVIGNDLQNETIQSGKIRNGTVGAVDLAPGVANKLKDVVSAGGLGRPTGSPYNLTFADAPPLSLKAGQRVVINGYASFYSQNAVLLYIGTCGFITGAPATAIINADFIGLQGNERLAVNGLYTAEYDQTVTLGPCASHGETAPAVAISSGYTRYTLTVLNP